jgi:hypothetical protein
MREASSFSTASTAILALFSSSHSNGHVVKTRDVGAAFLYSRSKIFKFFLFFYLL